ncbi:hypothetical protein DFJ73DRAFT_854118 [Zopfochytrium polystomum]|nr:hypothetical protein DFJ73DRAFT_854118 [Zopfochytrium polystomum]
MTVSPPRSTHNRPSRSHQPPPSASPFVDASISGPQPGSPPLTSLPSPSARPRPSSLVFREFGNVRRQRSPSPPYVMPASTVRRSRPFSIPRSRPRPSHIPPLLTMPSPFSLDASVRCPFDWWVSSAEEASAMRTTPRRTFSEMIDEDSDGEEIQIPSRSRRLRRPWGIFTPNDFNLDERSFFFRSPPGEWLDDADHQIRFGTLRADGSVPSSSRASPLDRDDQPTDLEHSEDLRIPTLRQLQSSRDGVRPMGQSRDAQYLERDSLLERASLLPLESGTANMNDSATRASPTGPGPSDEASALPLLPMEPISEPRRSLSLITSSPASGPFESAMPTLTIEVATPPTPLPPPRAPPETDQSSLFSEFPAPASPTATTRSTTTIGVSSHSISPSISPSLRPRRSPNFSPGFGPLRGRSFRQRSPSSSPRGAFASHSPTSAAVSTASSLMTPLLSSAANASPAAALALATACFLAPLSPSGTTESGTATSPSLSVREGGIAIPLMLPPAARGEIDESGRPFAAGSAVERQAARHAGSGINRGTHEVDAGDAGRILASSTSTGLWSTARSNA